MIKIILILYLNFEFYFFRMFKYIIRTFTILLGISLLLSSLFLFLTEYEKFIHIILERAGKLDKIEEFKNSYLSETKFFQIKIIFLIITISYYTVVYKYYRLFEKKIIEFYDFIKEGFSVEISKISKNDWYLFSFVFALASFIKIYYFFTQPITNDEAFTFLSYVNQGFAASLTYYNLTNNHILHSLMCNFFYLLPLNPIYSLRIASFLVGLVLLFVVFILFRKLLNKKAAFLAFVFFSFAPATIQYGFLARGYGLILLFTVISTFSLFLLFEKTKNRKKLWLIFILSSALGFYSIPIYIYVFASHLVFYFTYLLIKNKLLIFRELKELFVVSFIVVVLVFLLYSPVIFVSGLDSLIAQEHVKGLLMRDFLLGLQQFLFPFVEWIFGGNLYFTILSFIILPISLFYSFRKKQNLFLLILSFIIVPLLLSILLRVVPLNRLFIFGILVMSLIIGLFVEQLMKIKVNKIFSESIILLSALFIILSMSASLNLLCKEQTIQNNKAYSFANKIETNSTVFCTHSARYYTFLKFKAELLDKKEIELYREDFDTNFAYDFVSETKALNENYILTSKHEYILIYDDEFIKLYKRQKN